MTHSFPTRRSSDLTSKQSPMNIGEFSNNNGRLMGSIATRTIDLPRLGLRPVESDHERAPAYEIVALNVGNRWVQLGALWEAVAKNTTGEVFLQGSDRKSTRLNSSH